MLFNSLEFAAFFVVIYVLYLATMRRVRAQNLLLLAGSYFFYGCWDWRFLGLIALSTTVDFLVALVLDRRRGGPEGPLY
jgi:D-alanyl-lipoteichoic acid acyltransferase DltB (MBOAT superfamily)